MIDVHFHLQHYQELIEKTLDQLISSDSSPYAQLFEAARYAILGPGKRIRPLLTLLTTEMLKGDLQAALIPACTLEFIHTYSLIHDDLPCMDDDDYRRGKLTVHKKYSEGHAVLTGDFLLTYAFEILSQSPSLSAEKKIQLMTILAQRSGAHGMIGGQVMDISYESLDLQSLTLLHNNKTGALLTAALEFGAIIANASHTDQMHLQQFGQSIGLAFQIVDDILDITSSHAKHGRAHSSDMMNQKTTYVSLLGLEQAQKYAQKMHEQALQELAYLPYNTTPLQQIAQFIIQRHS